MPTDEERGHEQDHFNQWLDDQVLGRTTPHAFTDAMELDQPASAFAEAFAALGTPRDDERKAHEVMSIQSTAPPVSLPAPAPPVLHRPKRRAWPGSLMTAATIALVLGLGFLALRPVLDQRDDPDSPHRNPGLADTPGSTATAGFDQQTLLGGFAGTDAGYGLGPLGDLSDALTYAKPLAGVPGFVPNLGIFGIIGLSQELPGSLDAIDLATGAQLWTLKLQVRGKIVSDGTRIYLSFANDTTAEYGLAAFDSFTGQRVWFVPDMMAAGFESTSQGPLVADGVVYMHDDYQTFFAVDAASGAMRWTTTLDYTIQRSIPGDFGERGVLSAAPQTAIDGEALVVMVGQQYLSALNRQDGSLLATTVFRDSFTSGTPQSEFSMRDGVAYVSSGTYGYREASPTTSNTPELLAGAITAIRPITGELLWRSDIDALQRVAVAAGDRLIALTATGIVSLDRASGGDRIDLPLGTSDVGSQWLLRTDGANAWITVSTEGLLTVIKTDGLAILQTWELAVDGFPALLGM